MDKSIQVSIAKADVKRGLLATIYLARHRESGKAYVGFTTKTLEQRRQKHLNASRHTQSNSIFHKALKKHGVDSFDWEVLHQTPNIELAKDELEKEYIAGHGTKTPHGYNLTDGGEGVAGHAMPDRARESISKTLTGRKRAPFTEAHKQRISDAAKGRTPHNKGKSASMELRRKLSAAHKGHKASAETIQRMSEGAKRAWARRKANG
ncbi:MAG: GIY-YIG nuclease family protein [Dehalococcoidia bacterium]|nr:GIY-YIG nuclease family protein [Dehalococcoidia bacterium]